MSYQGEIAAQPQILASSLYCIGHCTIFNSILHCAELHHAAQYTASYITTHCSVHLSALQSGSQHTPARSTVHYTVNINILQSSSRLTKARSLLQFSKHCNSVHHIALHTAENSTVHCSFCKECCGM